MKLNFFLVFVMVLENGIGRRGGREGSREGQSEGGREDEGGFGLGRWVTIEKRPRQFLLKAKLGSERPRRVSLVCELHPPPPTSICRNLSNFIKREN